MQPQATSTSTATTISTAADRGAAAPPAWAVWTFATSLGLWTGAVVFLSAGVMPVLFMNLEPSDAGRIAALIFPVYFRAGLALGVIACVAAFALMRSGGRLWQAVFGALIVMTLAQAWTTLVIHPEMSRIRGVESSVERFQQLHRLSVRLNSVVLGGGLLLLGGSALLLSRRHGAR